MTDQAVYLDLGRIAAAEASPPRSLAARMILDDRMALARFLDIYGPDTVLATIAEIRQSKQQRDKTDG